MFKRTPCEFCGYPGPDTRPPEVVSLDAINLHTRVWGWDHEYQPDEAGACITCRRNA